ncbi:MAG: glycosyltransferase family 39 protein [Saprospiraceae bacterium]|nr:glycosyltransferase family 39 protein [Saprospiraceae bacterium]
MMKTALKFLPLLFLYIIIILLFSKDYLQKDEPRYLQYAENIVNGFFTTADNPYLMNGVGYPAYLAIFVGLGLPLIVPKLFNALLTYLAIIYLYKSILLFTGKEKTALVFAYLLGLYYPMFYLLPLNQTDCLSLLLTCAFIYFTAKSLRSEKMGLLSTLIPGLLLGFLIQNKLVIAYPVIAMLIFSVGHYVIFRAKKSLKFTFVMAIGFACLVPYFLYTYSLTGRKFYFGTNGGEALYWMSTNYKNEFGAWFEVDSVLAGKIPDIHPDHIKFLSEVNPKPWVERKDLLSERAIENIKNNPKDYAINIVCNTLRLLFDAPDSYAYQTVDIYIYLFFNSFFLIPLIFTLYPAWVHRFKLPFEITGLTLFALCYLGCHILLTSEARYFILAIPFIIIWIVYFYKEFINVKFLFKDGSSQISIITK